jgi:serine/threonine-protein kinase RIO1
LPDTDAAREAVMQLVKLHLPPLEVQLIEEALRKGAHQQQADEAPSERAQGNVQSVWHVATEQPNLMHSEDWPTPSEQMQRAALSSVLQKDSRFLGTPDSFHFSELIRDLSLEERRMTRDTDSDERRTSLMAGYDLSVSGAEDHLSEEELLIIQLAMEDVPEHAQSRSDDDENVKLASMVHISDEDSEAIARAVREADEEETIARALREADEEDERKSLELALKIQQEDEEMQYSAPGGSIASRQRLQQQGNVRTMTRAEYESHGIDPRARFSIGSTSDTDGPISSLLDDEEYVTAGYRMNSMAQQQWSRRDQNVIVGPNMEVRTKHDTLLQGQANAHRLGLETEEVASIGNQAYNSFMQSMKGTKKGVVTKGTGRAGSDADATKGGVMDPKVRGHISRAINNDIIEKCNGVVKEGKEAVVYHADKGADSGGFDVAVKVFKRIEKFRGRGDYVDGDPRYGKSSFRNLSSRDQLELWAEKEFRNLIRANRAGVPVPTPLLQKENIVFMRFLGADGWPAPQLRELELRHGSKRWVTLYAQVLDAMKW